MTPIGESSADYRDYGDFIAGEISDEFKKFVNDNWIEDEEDGIIEDTYVAMEYVKYFNEKREQESLMVAKRKKEKDQTLKNKVLDLLRIIKN